MNEYLMNGNMMNLKKNGQVKPDPQLVKLLQDHKQSFRAGFTDRLYQRVMNRKQEIMDAHFYLYLSRLLPRIAFFSILMIGVLLAGAYLFHGSLDHKYLLGADPLDETNFITYLILKK
jgi:hypothetical protein